MNEQPRELSPQDDPKDDLFDLDSFDKSPVPLGQEGGSENLNEKSERMANDILKEQEKKKKEKKEKKEK